MNRYQNRFKQKRRMCRCCGKILSNIEKGFWCLRCEQGRKIVKARGGSLK